MHGDGCACPAERMRLGDHAKVIRPGEPWHGDLVEILIADWPNSAREAKANICCYLVRGVTDGLKWYAMPGELEPVAASHASGIR